MKKLLLIFAIVSAVITINGAFLPLTTADAQIKEYQTLEDLPGIGKTVAFGEDSFTKYLNSAFNVGISVAILLAIIMMVIGGIEYMGSDSVFAKGAGKDKITQALWGLAIALGIFLFLNTINPDLVKLKLKIDRAKPAGIQAPGGGAPVTIIPQVTTLATSAVEKENRKTLTDAGIVINKDPCPSGVRWQDVPGGCTNVGGLPKQAIDKLVALKKACSCSITVTGGTEPGHASHGPGISIVDLSKNSNGLESYVKKIGSPTSYPGCSVGDKYSLNIPGTTAINSVFTDEKINGYTPHWHVCL